MRSETFTHGNITATVRSRTHRTEIIEARYKAAIRQAYPEIAEFETAMYQVTPPRRRLDDDKLNEAQRAVREEQFQALYDTYTSKTLAIRAKYPVGAARAGAMGNVVSLLGRLSSIEGASFALADDGALTDKDVIVAYEAWLDDDGTEDSFWFALLQTIASVDKPLTSPVDRPPEALTKEEQADPFLDAPVNVARKK